MWSCVKLHQDICCSHKMNTELSSISVSLIYFSVPCLLLVFIYSMFMYSSLHMYSYHVIKLYCQAILCFLWSLTSTFHPYSFFLSFIVSCSLLLIFWLSDNSNMIDLYSFAFVCNFQISYHVMFTRQPLENSCFQSFLNFRMVKEQFSRDHLACVVRPFWPVPSTGGLRYAG